MGGLSKIVKKTVSGVTNTIQKAGSQIINVAEDVGKAGGGILKAAASPIVGGGNQNTTTQAPDQSVQQAPEVQAPVKDNASADESGSTSSDIKKGRATGKKSLTVARASGGGVNV